MITAFYKSRLARVLAAVIVCALMIPVILRAGIELVGATYTVWTPDYDMIDILPIIQKEELTDEDYDTLFEQTGLTKLAIDDYLEKGMYG